MIVHNYYRYAPNHHKCNKREGYSYKNKMWVSYNIKTYFIINIIIGKKKKKKKKKEIILYNTCYHFLLCTRDIRSKIIVSLVTKNAPTPPPKNASPSLFFLVINLYRPSGWNNVKQHTKKR